MQSTLIINIFTFIPTQSRYASCLFQEVFWLGRTPESTMSIGLVPAVLDGAASAGHHRQALILLIFTVPQSRHY